MSSGVAENSVTGAQNTQATSDGETFERFGQLVLLNEGKEEFKLPSIFENETFGPEMTEVIAQQVNDGCLP